MSTQSTPYPPESHAMSEANRVTIAALIAERDQLRTDMQSANRLLADCEENRGNLIAAVAELHAERDQLQITDHLMTQNYNTLNNEAQELRQQVAALTAERNRLDSAGGGSLAAGIAACWQEIAALKNERDQLQALLHSQISINNELQQELLAKVEQLQAMLTD